MNLIRWGAGILTCMGLLLLPVKGNSQSSPTTAALVDYKVSLSGSRITLSSPVAGDLNGDGDLEIIIGGSDGMIYVIGFHNNTWSVIQSWQIAVDLNAAHPPTSQTDNNIQSSPALGDVDNDGDLDLVVTAGGDIHVVKSMRRNGGTLVYLNNGSGNLSIADRSQFLPSEYNPDAGLYGACTAGWPQPCMDLVGDGTGYSNPDGLWDGIVTSPALGDLDGDGDLEIVVAGIDRHLYAWHHNGVPVDGWPIYRYNGDPILRGGLSSPALGDLDGDGLPEVVVGTMSPYWEGESGPPPDYNTGTIWALNGDSSYVPGFPLQTEQYIHSSPALGDIDGDGRLEIVVGAGWGTNHRRNIVYAINHDGTFLPNWPRETVGGVSAPPALGDIDHDGWPEIVVGCGNVLDSSCGSLYAWNADGSLVSGFPMLPSNLSGNPAMPYSPVLADYDGDGQVEILVVHEGAWGWSVVSPSGDNETTYSVWGGLLNSVLVDDLDHDGWLEVIAAGANMATLDSGHGGVQISDLPGLATAACPWPMFHHDARRTGRLIRPSVLQFPAEIRLLHQYGTGDLVSGFGVVENQGEEPFHWQITHVISNLKTSPTSGSVTTTALIKFEITTTGVLTGWHPLGTVTVTGTAAGQSVQGSPAVATVYLYVGDVTKTYLPMILRKSP